MGYEVFKARMLSALLMPIFFLLVFLTLYIINGTLPALAWIILLLPLTLTILKLRERLLIRNDIMSYHAMFKTKEVSLRDVSQIVMTEVVTGDREDEKIKWVINVIDESGRTCLSFPSYLLSNKTESRFTEAVHSANSDIKITFD